MERVSVPIWAEGLLCNATRPDGPLGVQRGETDGRLGPLFVHVDERRKDKVQSNSHCHAGDWTCMPVGHADHKQPNRVRGEARDRGRDGQACSHRLGDARLCRTHPRSQTFLLPLPLPLKFLEGASGCVCTGHQKGKAEVAHFDRLELNNRF
jgi:hypothetical protein